MANCPRCNGNGYIWVQEILIHPVTKEQVKKDVRRKCPRCNGRGIEQFFNQ